MAIERDMNAINATLDDPKHKELAENLQEYLSYICRQYRFSKKRDNLIKTGVYEILRRVHEHETMLDGRDQANNNQEVPF